MLTAQLLKTGHRVTVLDSFRHGVPSLSALCSFDKLEVVRGDAGEQAVLEPLVKRADAVVALAALVGEPICRGSEAEAWRVNTGAIYTLAGLAAASQPIIFPCSNSGYGVGGEELCTEESPLQPVSVYGRSKVIAEERIVERRLGVSLRFATLFGASPRMRLDLMVNDFVYRAIRDRAIMLFEPNFRRNFLHVRDAVGAIVHALHSTETMGGKAFNAGDSRANMTKQQLAEKIKERVNFCISHGDHGMDPDKRDYVVSNARLEATGWKPLYSLEEGIAELARCFAQPFEGHRNA